MNRVIKFKYIWQHDSTGRFCEKIFTLDEIEKGEVQTPDFTIRWNLVARLPFTGLTDGIGKEIFEGDILQYDLYHDLGQSGKYTTHKTEVRFIESDAAFYPFHRYSSYTLEINRTEVLGSIFEHPDLLK